MPNPGPPRGLRTLLPGFLLVLMAPQCNNRLAEGRLPREGVFGLILRPGREVWFLAGSQRSRGEDQPGASVTLAKVPAEHRRVGDRPKGAAARPNLRPVALPATIAP